MKRAQQQEQKCRRMEFKCKLYGIIKDLDRSLKSECGHGQTMPPGAGQSGARGHHYIQADRQRTPQGSECCCPPGCCKQSLEFRMPRLLPRQDPAEESEDPHRTDTEYHQWHNEDHAWGCRPVGEGGPGSQRGGAGPGYTGGSFNPKCGQGSPNFGGEGGPGSQRRSAGPEYTGGSFNPKCGEGSPNSGGGCCSYTPIANPSPQVPFQFPASPEEAMQRGCFVARSA